MRPDLTSQLLAVRSELHGYIYSVVRDFHVAEDLFQDVAVVILQKAEKMGEIRDFRAWAKEIARREVRYHCRKRRKAGLAIEEMAEVAGDIFQSQSPPSSRLVLEVEALRICLGKLPERARGMLNLRFGADQSYRSIADLFQATEAAVRQIISRSRRAAAECLHQRLRQADQTP